MDKITKEQFIEIIKPICLEIWRSPREVDPAGRFTDMLVDKLLPKINRLVNSVKEEQKRESAKNFDIIKKEIIKLAKIVARRETKEECAMIFESQISDENTDSANIDLKISAKAIRDLKE